MSESASKAVFLSYASQDAEAARCICESLRSVGVEVWFDQNELVGGDAWDAKIRGQIKACALFVPVVSAATQARREGYFRLEWKLAAQRTHMISDRQAFLLPVMIDGTSEGAADVPEEFRAVQWTRLPGGETNAAFCARVKKLLGGEAAVAGSDVRAPLDGARGRGQAGPLRKPSRPWLVPAILGVAAVTALAFWQPWRAKEKSGPPASPAAVVTPAAPLSEAKQLVAKVWDLLNKPGMARAELDTADLLCKRASSLDPSEAEVWAAWAQTDVCYVWNSFDASLARRDAAREHLAHAIQLDPHSYEARLAQAAFLARGRPAIEYQPGSSSEAEPLLRELLRERPGEPRAAIELSIVVWTGEEFPLLESVAKNHPGFAARALNELAWRLYHTNRYAEADAASDRSIALNPNWGNLGLKIALALYWHGNLELAKATLRRMPTSALQEDWGAFLGFRVHSWRDEFADGLAGLSAIPREWLSSNLFSGPKALLSAELHRRAGQRELAGRDYQWALTQLDARLADQPNDTSLLARKAEALYYLERRSEADACYRLLRETGLPPALHLQVLFEPPEVALAALEGGVRDLNNNSATLTAAALRLAPQYAPLRSHPRFTALLARAEADPKLSPNAKSPNSEGQAALPPALDPKSVAVLAFANLSDDKGNEYFSDGISEELLTVLQKIPGLHVAARTSAFSFKGKNATAQEIGATLNVAHLVEGSVQKIGNRVKISARLSRVATGEQLWSENFTRDLADVFAVQSEIAQTIVAQLRGQLTGEVAAMAKAEIQAQVQAAEKGGTRSAEAHELYLQGKFFAYQTSLNNLAKAADYFRRATDIDPKFALAWAALARAISLRAQFADASPKENAAVFAQSKQAVARALEIEPNLVEALSARFENQVSLEFDWRGARDSLERALALSPADPTLVAHAARQARIRGELEKSTMLARDAVALDPIDAELHWMVGKNLSSLGRLTEAEAAFRKALELNPATLASHRHLAYVLLRQGRYAEAVAEAQKETMEWSRQTPIALSSWAAGNRAQADAALAAMLRVSDTCSYQIAEVHAFRGDREGAFAWLERAWANRDAGIQETRADYFLTNLHADPRWPAFLEKVGLSDEQLK